MLTSVSRHRAQKKRTGVSQPVTLVDGQTSLSGAMVRYRSSIISIHFFEFEACNDMFADLLVVVVYLSRVHVSSVFLNPWTCNVSSMSIFPTETILSMFNRAVFFTDFV